MRPRKCHVAFQRAHAPCVVRSRAREVVHHVGGGAESALGHVVVERRLRRRRRREVDKPVTMCQIAHPKLIHAEQRIAVAPTQKDDERPLLRRVVTFRQVDTWRQPRRLGGFAKGVVKTAACASVLCMQGVLGPARAKRRISRGKSSACQKGTRTRHGLQDIGHTLPHTALTCRRSTRGMVRILRSMRS
eukprot:274477-Pleurochrysis_carterae.AAC.2